MLVQAYDKRDRDRQSQTWRGIREAWQLAKAESKTAANVGSKTSIQPSDALVDHQAPHDSVEPSHHPESRTPDAT